MVIGNGERDKIKSVLIFLPLAAYCLQKEVCLLGPRMLNA